MIESYYSLLTLASLTFLLMMVVRPNTRSQARQRQSHIDARVTPTPKDNAVRTRLIDELQALGIQVPSTLAIGTLRSLLAQNEQATRPCTTTAPMTKPFSRSLFPSFDEDSER